MLIQLVGASSVKQQQDGRIVRPNEVKFNVNFVKRRKPSSPRATLLTELFVFDRLFYYFPFGFYNHFKTYNSTSKEPYVI